MNKDEMKNRISLALKDPILQQGFEIMCKKNAGLKEKQYIRFIELAGISITRKEYEGVKLFMEIEELIQETEKAFCSLKEIISDYSAREENAKTETKILMLVNKWTSPYIACTELVKRIETNEMFIKNICKASGTTLTKIGYKTKAKEARELIQAQANK